MMRNISDNKMQGTHDKYTDAYINILNAYKDQISSSVEKRNALKEQFFNTIKTIMNFLTWIFAGTLGISLILFGIMILNNYKSIIIVTGAITTILSSFATMIISIFKLPEIIANYLFNKEEDNLMSEIIKNIQKYEIDAVKYELDNIKYEYEKLKVEKLKELNSDVSSNSNNISNDLDDDLKASTYNMPSPSQKTKKTSVKRQTTNNNKDTSAS